MAECFVCPVHGVVHASACIACRALHYKERMKRGLSQKIELVDGGEIAPNDPSPSEIKLMTAVIRAQQPRQEDVVEPSVKWWRKKRRTVKVYSAQIFEDLIQAQGG